MKRSNGSVWFVLSLFLLVFVLVSPASAALSVSQNIGLNSAGLYTISATASPAARVHMDLYQGTKRCGRVLVKKVSDGRYEGTIRTPLALGEYTVKIREVIRSNSGKVETNSTAPLHVAVPYRPVIQQEISSLSLTENIVTPARPLPFLGTTQPTIINAYGTNGGDTPDLEGDLISMAKGDLNGDGVPDIVAGGQTLFAYDVKNKEYLWAIDESGGALALAERINDIAIADITGDGVPDVVTIDRDDPDGTTGVGSDGLCLWDGADGHLIWTQPMTSYGSYEIDHVEVLAIADVDGDGDLDVVAGGYHTTYGECIATFNGQTGALLHYFRTPADDTNLSEVGNVYCLKVGDIDGDGKPEIAVGDSNYQVYCLNAEDLSERFTLTIPDNDYVYSMELADLNQDGNPEIVAGSYYYVTAYDKNGGQLWQFDDYANYSEYWTALAVADFNGDGVPDIAAVNYDYAWAIIDGKTGFAISDGSTYDYGTCVTAGDLNGDNIPEMVWGDDDYGTAAVDATTGNWLWWHDYNDDNDNGSGDVGQLLVGDFNGDGNNEVIGLPEWEDFLYVLPGKADSNVWGRGFEPFGYYWDNNYSELHDVASADLNGDGTPDVIVVDDNNCQVTAMNGKTGEALWSRYCSGSPWILATGDFCGDGKPEVAAFGELTGYLMDSDGTLLAQWSTNSTSNFMVRDINNDGKDELILGRQGDNVVAMSFPGGVPTQMWDTLDINFHYVSPDSSCYEVGLAWGDIDGDGTPKLLALGYDYGQGMYVVYSINVEYGNGTPTVIVQSPTRAWSTIAVGQLDDDAQKEILLGYSGGINAWDHLDNDWQGLGYTSHSADRYLLAGDMDGDGFDEAVFAGRQNVGVLEQGGTEKWSKDLSGTAANYYNDYSDSVEDMILADLDGDGDLDVAVGAYEGLNLLMLDGLTGDNLIDPVIIDGYGYDCAELAAGDFSSGAGTEIATIGFQSAGVFAVHPVSHASSGGGGGSLPVGPLAAGISAFLVWWKRRKQR